jgi:acyl carrier protein
VPPGEPPVAGPSWANGARIRGPVAVCTLGSPDLVAVLARASGVSLVGCLRTANLGIAQIVRAILDRPWVRHLVVCGRDSPLFRQGQSLVALIRSGVDPADHRIVDALGHLPYLADLDLADVDAFRRQIVLSDLRGVEDPRLLAQHVGGLMASTDSYVPAARRARRPSFKDLHPVGRRQPIATAGDGFFVISTTRRPKQVVVEHYHPDLRPAHRLRGRRAESLLLGILGAGLVRSVGHAGYLGAELAKAETALRLGLTYEQDRPLRQAPADGTGGSVHKTIDTCEEFSQLIAKTVGAAETVLKPEVPLVEQLEVDSLRMMELAVVLEQDLGLTLRDDLDLRTSTPAELYQQYTDG